MIRQPARKNIPTEAAELNLIPKGELSRTREKEKPSKRKNEEELLPPAPLPLPIIEKSPAAPSKHQKPNISVLSFADDFKEDMEMPKFKMTPSHGSRQDSQPQGSLKPKAIKEESAISRPMPPAFSFVPAAPEKTASFGPKTEKQIDFPDVTSIIKSEIVRKKLLSALRLSVVEEREHGGYIFWNPISNEFVISNAELGRKKEIDLDKPSGGKEGFMLVANYHTHPNETGHYPPSEVDELLSSARGIPGIVIASNNTIYFSGPSKRREAGKHLHNYPVPDPEKGYTTGTIPKLQPGEAGKAIDQIKR